MKNSKINLLLILIFMFWYFADLPSKIFCSTGPAVEPHNSQRYLNKYLVDSVFPAPDSPETIIDWDCFSPFISRNALSARKEFRNYMICTK